MAFSLSPFSWTYYSILYLRFRGHIPQPLTMFYLSKSVFSWTYSTTFDNVLSPHSERRPAGRAQARSFAWTLDGDLRALE